MAERRQTWRQRQSQSHWPQAFLVFTWHFCTHMIQNQPHLWSLFLSHQFVTCQTNFSGDLICVSVHSSLRAWRSEKKLWYWGNCCGNVCVGMCECWRRVGTEVGRWRTEVVCGGIRWWCEGVTGFRSLLRNEKGQVGNMPLKVYEKNHWHFKKSGGLALISAWSFTEEPKNRHIQYTHESTQTRQSLSISPTAMSFKTDFLSTGTDTHIWLYLHMSEHPDQANLF